MSKKSKKRPTGTVIVPRSPVALEMALHCHASVMKDRRVPRAGSKNLSRDLENEYEASKDGDKE
jgi:hypothetical protein